MLTVPAGLGRYAKPAHSKTSRPNLKLLLGLFVFILGQSGVRTADAEIKVRSVAETDQS